MTTTFNGNLKLTEMQNVVQKYTITVTTAAAPGASAALVFDAPFSVVPDIISVEVLDTDGTKRSLLDDVYADTRTVSGLTVKLHGKGDANIGVGTMTVEVLVHGKL